jgi:methyl-accepting chemotaxis protein
MKSLKPSSQPRGPHKGLLDRLSVRGQLRLAFGALLLLMTLLGGTALFGLQQVDAQAQALAGKWLRGVNELALTRVALIEQRAQEVKHSLTDDSSYHSEYEDKIAEQQKQIDEQLKSYAVHLRSADEQQQFQQLQQHAQAYRQAQQQVVKLGRERQQADAADVSDGLSSMAFDEVLSTLDQLSAYNVTQAQQAAATADATYGQARWAVLALLGVAVALGLTLAVLIVRKLVGQLGGEPAQAVAVARAVAAGDLSTSIQLQPGDASSLMAQLHAMQQSLASTVNAVRSTSEQVATASSQIAQGNQDLSGRTEQQASALQQTAATMDQLGSTVRNNADNARQANQLAQSATGVARKGGEVVDQVVQTMRGINDSSRKIADIIGTIDGIAFQTNILALNAAVEAARAGEQGRGFAVVASEVRSLAQRSAEAAREIKQLISTSVERVDQGSVLVDEAGRTMSEIVTSIGRVNDIVSEISAASSEQSNGVSQVGQAVTQMDQTTQQNAALVEQSAAAAESLRQQAQQLVRAVAVFKLA